MVGEGGGAADEAIHRSRQNHLADFRQMRRLGGDRRGGKPARNGWIGQHRHALRPYNGDPLFPLLGGGGSRCAGGVADDDPVEPLGMALRQAHGGRAAHR